MVDKSNCIAKHCLSFQTVVIRMKIKIRKKKKNFKLNLVELLTLVLIGIELNFPLSYKATTFWDVVDYIYICINSNLNFIYDLKLHGNNFYMEIHKVLKNKIQYHFRFFFFF